MSEGIIALLSAGFGSGIMAIILAWLNRKWAKQDKQDDRMDAVVDALKEIMIDRVRWLGKRYIAEHGISLEDKESIEGMFKAYKSLGGNGHLDTVMDEVERLPVRSVR